MKKGLILIPMLAILGACAAGGSAAPDVPSAKPAPQMVSLSGNAFYRERIALPPTAELIVQIRDVSLMDAPAPLIAETRVKTEGRQVPLAFTIDYDRAMLNPRHRYAVSARIEDGGTLRWITDTHHPLPEPGSGPLSMMLVSTAR